MSFSGRDGEHIEAPARAVAFLQQILRLNSVNPPGNEELVARCIASRFDQVPRCDVTLVPIAPGRTNIEIVLRAKRKARPSLLFTGHFDTVAPGDLANWTHDPFAAELIDGTVYGRGAADMKGGVAAMVLALEALARSPVELACDVIFLGTVGEEVDQIGAQSFVDRGKMTGVGAVVVGSRRMGTWDPRIRAPCSSGCPRTDVPPTAQHRNRASMPSSI